MLGRTILRHKQLSKKNGKKILEWADQLFYYNEKNWDHLYKRKQQTWGCPWMFERQVASTLYYLSNEGRIRKTVNALGLSRSVISNIISTGSRSVISNIIGRVCIVITVHLGSKYIKLPFSEAEVKELVQFYKRFTQNTISMWTEINRFLFIKYKCVDGNQLFRFYWKR